MADYLQLPEVLYNIIYLLSSHLPSDFPYCHGLGQFNSIVSIVRNAKLNGCASPIEPARGFIYLLRDLQYNYHFPPFFPLFRSLRFLPMRAPSGLATLALGSASPTGSDLALAICLSVVVRRFLASGSSDFLISASSLRRLCSGVVLESVCY